MVKKISSLILLFASPALAGVISNSSFGIRAFPATVAAAAGGATCGGTIHVYQSTGHTSADSLTLVTTNAVTAGHSLFFAVSGSNDFGVNNIVVDSQGNAWKLVRAYNAATYGNLAIYSSTAIGTGGSNYTITANNGGATMAGALIEVEGTDCLGVEDGADDETGTSSTPGTGSISTTVDGLMIGVGGHDTGIVGNWVASNGFAQVYQQPDNVTLQTVSVIWKKTTAGANTANWTHDESLTWFVTAVEFK